MDWAPDAQVAGRPNGCFPIRRIRAPDPKPTDVGSKSFGGFLIIELPVAATGIGLVVGHRSHWLPSDMILR